MRKENFEKHSKIIDKINDIIKTETFPDNEEYEVVLDFAWSSILLRAFEVNYEYTFVTLLRILMNVNALIKGNKGEIK